MQKRMSVVLTMMFMVGSLIILGDQNTVAAASDDVIVQLKQDDCIKCHSDIVEMLSEGKSKHESETSCAGCHSGQHPPKSQKGDLIPKCSKCHTGAPHFELHTDAIHLKRQICINCHRNPHKPLDIFLEGEGNRDTCGSCHRDKVTELDSHPSSHTGFACSFCHKKHKDSPNCLTCHEPHAYGQVYEDCRKCHEPHQPLTLMYASTPYASTPITNDDCGACHQFIQEKLEASSAKHSKFNCTFCHADKHGVVPECTQCHNISHDNKMLRNFKSCNECHESAHDVLG